MTSEESLRSSYDTEKSPLLIPSAARRSRSISFPFFAPLDPETPNERALKLLHAQRLLRDFWQTIQVNAACSAEELSAPSSSSHSHAHPTSPSHRSSRPSPSSPHFHIVTHRSDFAHMREIYNAYNTDGSGQLSLADAFVYLNDLAALVGVRSQILKLFNHVEVNCERAWRAWLRRALHLLQFPNHGTQTLDFEQLLLPWEMEAFLRVMDLTDLRTSTGEVVMKPHHIQKLLGATTHDQVAPSQLSVHLEDQIETKKVELVQLKELYRRKKYELYLLEVRIGKRPWKCII